MTDTRGPIAVVLAQYPDDERDRRQAAVRASTPEGRDVVFVEIEGSVYRKGLTNYHRSLVAPLVAQAAVRAEREGASAVVPYGTLDLGIEEARHAVDIPVMGPGRTGTNVSASVGSRLTVLCYDEPHVIMFRQLVRSWNLAHHIVGIRSVDVPITEMARDPEHLRRRFVETAQRALDEDGADVILPLGMTMVPVLMSARSLADEIGVPVTDPLALTLHAADALAAIGFTNSRVAYPKVEL